MYLPLVLSPAASNSTNGQQPPSQILDTMNERQMLVALVPRSSDRKRIEEEAEFVRMETQDGDVTLNTQTSPAKEAEQIVPPKEEYKRQSQQKRVDLKTQQLEKLRESSAMMIKQK